MQVVLGTGELYSVKTSLNLRVVQMSVMPISKQAAPHRTQWKVRKNVGQHQLQIWQMKIKWPLMQIPCGQ